MLRAEKCFVLHEIHKRDALSSNESICMMTILCRVEQFVSSNIHHAPSATLRSLAGAVDCFDVVGNFVGIGIEFSTGGTTCVISSDDAGAMSDQIT